MFIDHPVVDFTGFMVIPIFGKNDSAARPAFSLEITSGFMGLWRIAVALRKPVGKRRGITLS